MSKSWSKVARRSLNSTNLAGRLCIFKLKNDRFSSDLILLKKDSSSTYEQLISTLSWGRSLIWSFGSEGSLMKVLFLILLNKSNSDLFLKSDKLISLTWIMIVYR